MLLQSLDDKLQSLTVALEVFGKYNNITKIYKEDIKCQITEHDPQKVLKGGWCIAQPEQHPRPLEQLKWGSDGCHHTHSWLSGNSQLSNLVWRTVENSPEHIEILPL